MKTESTEPTASERAVEGVNQLFPGFTLEEFFSTKWPDERHYARGDAARLEGLIGLPVLREYQRLLELRDGDANVMLNDAAGRELSGNFPAERSLILMQAGASLLLPAMGRVIEPLGAVCRRVEQAAGFPYETVETSVHMSPPGRGVALHFDKYDVIVVMVRGRKRWRVARTPVLEYPTQSYNAGTPLPAEVAIAWPEQDGPVAANHVPPEFDEFDLEPGTALFVPRGVWHQTQAIEESVSIQIEIYAEPWVTLLLDKVRKRLLSHGRWRQPALGGFGGKDHPNTQRATERLETLLAGWMDDVGPITPVDIFGAKPALTSVDEVMEGMRKTFQPEAAADLKAVYQFRVNGPGGKDFFIQVDGANLKVEPGSHPAPSVTLSMNAADLLLLTAHPSQAIPLTIERRLRFFPEDFELLSRIFSIFGMFA